MRRLTSEQRSDAKRALWHSNVADNAACIMLMLHHPSHGESFNKWWKRQAKRGGRWFSTLARVCAYWAEQVEIEVVGRHKLWGRNKGNANYYATCLAVAQYIRKNEDGIFESSMYAHDLMVWNDEPLPIDENDVGFDWIRERS